MDKPKKIDVTLYLVTDSSCLCEGKDLFTAVKEAVEAGVTLVQYRDKHASGKKMLENAIELKKICHAKNVPLLVNDRLDIALLSGCDGVHLGQDDIPVSKARRLAGKDFIIGATAHNVKEALKAQKDGADYLGCGAVFATSTKKDTVPLGLEGLAAICREVGIPVAGIAGINAANYPDVLAAGADGAAVVSAIMGKSDIGAAVRSFLAASGQK